MLLRANFIVTALKLQEAADSADTPHSIVRSRLSDAINDAHRGSGNYAYYQDHTGDGESGDVIYSVNGDMKKAPYEIGQTGDGKATCGIDTANAVGVVPETSYREEADDSDNYTAMSEAFKADKLYTDLPVYERFISKAERDKADDGDFAGKGKSFPILKPEDVSAAVRAMGRAGAGNLGPSGIKARIIAIAKKKGWTARLPKAWQTGGAKEAAKPAETGALQLVESAAAFLAEIPLKEAARSSYPIKLISPGTGTTAHYPAAVLERDGPKVFKKGTLMFWNHPTAAEEAARPEGNLDNLAAILTSDSRYDANGSKGPGLYAEAKVMGDYAEKVAERAPHIGLSIRAGGTTDGTRVDGKPVLKSLDYAESVDYVTKAGRGGLALAEAARDAGILEETDGMTADEIKRLVEAGVSAATAPLKQRALRGDALIEASRVLKTITLPETSKQRVIDNVLRDAVPVTATGEIDVTRLTEAVTAEAKREGVYVAALTGAGRVTGMGVAAPVETTEALKPEEINARSVKTFQRLGLSEAAAKAAVRGRAA